MRISDWRSDVCSSDLPLYRLLKNGRGLYWRRPALEPSGSRAQEGDVGGDLLAAEEPLLQLIFGKSELYDSLVSAPYQLEGQVPRHARFKSDIHGHLTFTA